MAHICRATELLEIFCLFISFLVFWHYNNFKNFLRSGYNLGKRQAGWTRRKKNTPARPTVIYQRFIGFLLGL